MKNLRKFNESVESTRVLIIGDGDFCAIDFKKEYSGTKVSDIINNIEKYESDDWELSVRTFGSVDPKFVNFIRDEIQDYDQSKDKNFYFEYETI
jgi:hypothetical protein